MRRLFVIARREYLAYVRTVGFWLSMIAVPLGMALVLGVTGLMEASTPAPAVVVVDLTPGKVFTPAIRDALEGASTPGAPRALRRGMADIVEPPLALPTEPNAIGQALRPWLSGDERLSGDRRLAGAFVVHGAGDEIAIDVWTDNPLLGAGSAVRSAVGQEMERRKLEAGGVDPALLAEAAALKPRVTDYAPKTAERASIANRMPGIVGFGAAMLLWSVVFTGAGILLNGVIEEKSSKVLEVLLSSATVPEILFGKILGVAAVTFTVLAVWGGIGLFGLTSTAPELAAGVTSLLLKNGLIFYFIFYLAAGYLMYAAIFTAIGAFCETTREAQTLLGPIMIVLTIPVLFLSQALRRPDTPALEILSWIPPFTPFMMTARAASNPPLWQVIGTGAVMLATVAVVVWIAGRAFRAGAMSTGKVDFKTLFARLRGGE